jgi:hypothetical protein
MSVVDNIRHARIAALLGLFENRGKQSHSSSLFGDNCGDGAAFLPEDGPILPCLTEGMEFSFKRSSLENHQWLTTLSFALIWMRYVGCHADELTGTLTAFDSDCSGTTTEVKISFCHSRNPSASPFHTNDIDALFYIVNIFVIRG